MGETSGAKARYILLLWAARLKPRPFKAGKLQNESWKTSKQSWKPSSQSFKTSNQSFKTSNQSWKPSNIKTSKLQFPTLVLTADRRFLQLIASYS
jgi:hypothetical protein